jgi:hypothetical protein
MQKTEVQGLYKVSEGVLVNTDNEALVAYKKRMIKEKNIDKMQDDIISLKEDLKEIKDLLRGLAK